MNRRVLVLTTVHHPDDNRIREKTIRTLSSEFEITYAARDPGPTDRSGLVWRRLRGGRLRRNIEALVVAWSGRFDIVSIHDPELLPLGIVLGQFRRSSVVFDMHEDVPAQILNKDWIPRKFRSTVSWLVRCLLGFAERKITFTLAEESYARSLDRPHPVIRNYPVIEHLPRAACDGEGAVYVGGVTVERGALDAIAACAQVGMRLMLVGPVDHRIAAELRSAIEHFGADVELVGRLPHHAAMEIVASAAVALSPLHDIANYRESIPTKVLEYLGVGVPVAASDLPATRRLVEGMDAVALHTPGDPASLAAAMMALTGAGVVARVQVDRVRAEFTWAGDLLLELYADLAR
jgi:glycosyltransferase involved in cell wall biosynthesis